jgi:hypothetical protein
VDWKTQLPVARKSDGKTSYRQEKRYWTNIDSKKETMSPMTNTCLMSTPFMLDDLLRRLLRGARGMPWKPTGSIRKVHNFKGKPTGSIGKVHNFK